ncbi:MAG TPA: response regulator [Planctomycetota bacterium]|nr:response regulator [Planctomycetota bacterium]
MTTTGQQASYTTGEVAHLCQVTKRTVIKWIDSGKLQGYTLPGSRHRRVSAEALRQFLRAHKLPDYTGLVRRRILVVDDDRDLLELLQDALRDQFDVDVASTALEAAARLPVFQPDVILLDIRLPDLSGLEVCRHFQGYKRERKVPILTMSAFGGEIDPAEVRRCGADAFLPKPLKMADLKKRITAMVG